MSHGFVKTNRSILQYEKWRTLSFSEQGFLENLALMSGWKEEEKGLVRLSIRTFEKESGKSHATIQSLLSKLKEKGIVTVKASKEGTCVRIEDDVYQKLVQGVPESSTRNNNDVYQNLVHRVPESSTGVYQNRVHCVPESSTQKPSYHINIEEEKNIEDIEDIPPMTSQDFPPYSEEDDDIFATLFEGSAPLEPMDEIPFGEPATPQEQDPPLQQEQAAKSQAAQSTQAQGTLPGLQSIEKNASSKQHKQPKEKLLPQWQQDFECWWKEFLSLSKGIEGKGGKAIGKAEARKAWERLRNKGELPSLQDMIEGLKKYAALNGWERNSQKYIPHASTFLNQKRWEDEVARSWGGSYGFNSNVSSQATPQPSLPNAPQPVKPTYSPWEEIVFQMSELGSNRIREAGFSQETLNAVKYIGGWGVLFNISSRELSFKKSEYEKYVRGA